jgi:hypothetical protein
MADARLPAVIETATAVTTSTLHSSLVVPAMVVDAGDRASRRFLNFFAASPPSGSTPALNRFGASRFERRCLSRAAC